MDFLERFFNFSPDGGDGTMEVLISIALARRPPWVLTKEEGMSDDRTKADKAWEARQEAARYRIFNAATNAAEATDEADDEKYFAVLDQAGNAAEAAAAEITGYKTYVDLLEALDTRRKQS